MGSEYGCKKRIKNNRLLRPLVGVIRSVSYRLSVGDYWVSGTTGQPAKGGKTILNVDFDQKTVDGKVEFSLLTNGRAQDITLHKTQLNGTKFNGRATTLLQEGTYEGGLFGNGAKEAAGIATFSGDSSYNTSFGGIRY